VRTIDGCGPSFGDVLLASTALCEHGVNARGDAVLEGRGQSRGTWWQTRWCSWQRALAGGTVGEWRVCSSGPWRGPPPLRRVFWDASCYDLASTTQFLISSADNIESATFDFRLRDMCWTIDDGACGGASWTRRTEEADEDCEGDEAIRSSNLGSRGSSGSVARGVHRVRHVLEGDLGEIVAMFLLFSGYYFQVSLKIVLEGDFRGYYCG
jgi:hypothetical protein